MTGRGPTLPGLSGHFGNIKQRVSQNWDHFIKFWYFSVCGQFIKVTSENHCRVSRDVQTDRSSQLLTAFSPWSSSCGVWCQQLLGSDVSVTQKQSVGRPLSWDDDVTVQAGTGVLKLSCVRNNDDLLIIIQTHVLTSTMNYSLLISDKSETKYCITHKPWLLLLWRCQ